METDEIGFAGIAEHARLIRDGHLSSVEVVDSLLGRIERVDPLLNAFSDVFAAEARADARRADGRVAAGEAKPLLGVHIAVKSRTIWMSPVRSHDMARVPTTPLRERTPNT